MKKWCKCGYLFRVEKWTELPDACPYCNEVIYWKDLVNEEPISVAAARRINDAINVEKVFTSELEPGYHYMGPDEASRLVREKIPHEVVATQFINLPHSQQVTLHMLVRVDGPEGNETLVVAPDLKQVFFEAALEVAENFEVWVQAPGCWVTPETMAKRMFEAWELMGYGEETSIPEDEEATLGAKDIPVMELWPGTGYPPPLSESPIGHRVSMEDRGFGTVEVTASDHHLLVRFDARPEQTYCVNANELEWLQRDV